jgi:hypothetical protein
MNASCAEQWFHYGTAEAPHTDVRFAADAVLRLYPDGSTIWKIKKSVQITPNIWDSVPDPEPITTID